MERKKLRIISLVLLDIFLVDLSFILSYLIRFDFKYWSIESYFRENIPHLLIISTILKISIFLIFNLYSSLWRYAGINEMISITISAFSSNSILMFYIVAIRYIYNSPLVKAPRGVFIIAFLLDIFLIGGVRMLYRIYRRMNKGDFSFAKNTKRILIVGAGDSGAMLVNQLKNNSLTFGYPIAMVDNDITKINREINGVPIRGTIEDIEKIAINEKIDEIIIAVNYGGKKFLDSIYEECLKTNCKVKILPSVGDLLDGNVSIQTIRNIDIEDLLGREPIELDKEGIQTYITGKSILITGGGGSIGSELCRQISKYMPSNLIILDNYENSAFEIELELRKIFENLNINVVIANIREKERLKEIFRKYSPNVIFHAAAHKHVHLMETNPYEAIKNNVFGTLNVVECAIEFKAKKFVLISTDKAVNPSNIMGATKRIAEIIVQSANGTSDTEFVAVRFGNVLGSNGSVIPIFKKQIEEGGPITVTHRDVSRYFMTIPEAVQLVIQAGAFAKGGEIFVLDMGQPVKIYDLARKLIKLSGYENDEDIKIQIIGLRPGEKLHEEILLGYESFSKTQNQKIYVTNPQKIDSLLLKTHLGKLKQNLLINDKICMEAVKNIIEIYNIKTS